MKRQIKSFLIRQYTKLLGLVHPVQKKVLFSNFGGNQYSDNPKAISEKLHKLYPDFKISWVINDVNKSIDVIPDYVKITTGGHSFFKELATSFCFVTNTTVGLSFYKKKKQYFIQTWHGDRPIKKVLYDADPEGLYMPPVMDYKLTDLAICASDIGEQVYRTAFRYKGEVLKVGSPRNDLLLHDNSDLRKRIMEKYRIPGNAKILLYAPTFRDFQKEKQTITVDLQQTLKLLNITDNQRWVCFVRAHYVSAGLLVKCDGKNFIDVTSHPDMADLLASVDMLITDYSSSAGDFVLRKKPVILAMFDIQEYKDSCRDFVCQPKEAGFIIANNQEELNTIIKTYTQDDYCRSCERVCEYFNIIETGESADEICKIINQKYEERFPKRH